MCVIERKTYLHPDGSQSTVETTRRCVNATGAGVCDDVQERRGQAELVVRVPPPSPREASDGSFVTEGFNGRKIVYRPVTSGLTRRTSKRSSTRPGTSGSSPSSMGTQSSPDRTLIEVRPSPSTPPSTASSDQRRVSFRYDTKPGSTESRPVSMESISSTSATVDEPLTGYKDTDYRKSLREGYSSPQGSPSSPALSDLPRVDVRRPKHDSAKSFNSSDKQTREVRPRAETSNSARRRQQIQDDAASKRIRQQEEDDRQAELERSRLAASDQRQAERTEAAFESSRERHRQAAAAALDGRARAQQQVDSELEQMRRERRRAEKRRSESQQSSPAVPSPGYSRAPLEYQPYDGTLRSPISPLSPRGPMSLPARSPSAIVHNNYPPPIDTTLRPSGFQERGEDVIGRQQARASRESQSSTLDRSCPQRETQRLEGAMRDMSFDGDFVLYDEDEDLEEYEPLPPSSGRRGGDRRRRTRPGRSGYYQ